MTAPKIKKMAAPLLLCAGIALFAAHHEKQILLQAYADLESHTLIDREGRIIETALNSKGNRALYISRLPTSFKKLLIAREDQYFYFHPGVNPISTARMLFMRVIFKERSGASTLTQQLAKNLLGNENDRTFMNKFREAWGAFSLELFLDKETILTMYGNSVYLGKGVQGFALGSEHYFQKKLESLDREKMLKLIATLQSPSYSYPGTKRNTVVAANLDVVLPQSVEDPLLTAPDKTETELAASVSNAGFELKNLSEGCPTRCHLSIDAELTEKLRSILTRTIAENNRFGVRHGAIVVIKLPENELLALVGSPDPTSNVLGDKINMALEPRPIGSTAKPFIFLEAFKKGARPYTRVIDREYSYPIGTGFPLYPKNYDGQYHGEVSLQYALSNSLNVPAVKTLEFVGLHSFYDFLVRSFNFKPLRDLQSYEYGIALGGLEVDPLTLSHLFTIFPNQGILKPLRLSEQGEAVSVPMSAHTGETIVAEPQFANLVTAVLNDRLQGIEQFGLVNNLNLPEKNFAVKTGTSRDYHDTWTIGFTPDFLVTTWLGNAENKPLQQVTGASGAGKVWQQTMELLMNSPYNKHTPLNLSGIERFNVDGVETFGLKDDNVAFARDIMLKDVLIFHPHNGDTFLLETHAQIPLIASKQAEWFLDGKPLGTGEKIYFTPVRAGHFEISARAGSKTERIVVEVQDR